VGGKLVFAVEHEDPQIGGGEIQDLGPLFAVFEIELSLNFVA